MDDDFDAGLEKLEHLGLISSIIKDFGIDSRIDELLPKKSNNYKLTHSQAIQCMIYLGLGFTDKRFYTVQKFFKNRPVNELLGDIDFSGLNDDVLGKALDAIYSYGPRKFFSDVCFDILAKNDLISYFLHMDTTTHHLFGRKYDKDKGIKITYGHAKQRKDLPQLIQLLVTTTDGIPLWSECFSGNKSDREIFKDSVTTVRNYFEEKGVSSDFTIIADSALYSKKFLLNKKIKGHWITRVPESIGLAKKLLSRDRNDWVILDNKVTYKEVITKIKGVRQRWILVNNRKSKYKELETLKKKLEREVVVIGNRAKKLNIKVFQTREAMNQEFNRFKKSHPLFNIKNIPTGVYKGRKKTRKHKVGIRCSIGFEENAKAINELKNRKGSYIIACNNFDYSLTPEKIIKHYSDRNNSIEKNFKFLKDRKLRLNEVFLKRVDRIEALMAVMALVLFINNLGQMKLRKALRCSNNIIPGRTGKKSKNPTLKWAFELMSDVVRFKVNFCGKTIQKIDGIGATQRIIISCFGTHAEYFYGFP